MSCHSPPCLHRILLPLGPSVSVFLLLFLQGPQSHGLNDLILTPFHCQDSISKSGPFTSARARISVHLWGLGDTILLRAVSTQNNVHSEQCPDFPLLPYTSPTALSGSPGLPCLVPSPPPAASPVPSTCPGLSLWAQWSWALPASLPPPQVLPTSLQTLLGFTFPQANSGRILEISQGLLGC